MKFSWLIRLLSENRHRDGQNSHSPREEARRGAQRAFETAGQDGLRGHGPPTRIPGRRALRASARRTSDVDRVGRGLEVTRVEYHPLQVETTRTHEPDRQQYSVNPPISYQPPPSKPENSWLQAKDDAVSHDGSQLINMTTSEQGSNHPALPYPQVKDVDDIVGPWQNQGSPAKAIRRIEEGSSDLTAIMERISKRLRRIKMEYPSIQFEKDIPHLCSPADVEMALYDLISAYMSLHQRSYDFETALGAKTAECDSLRKELNKWALRDKESEERVLSLKRENEKEKQKIEFLRDEFDTREQRHEDKAAKLIQKHQEELAIHETATKEEIARMIRDYDMWRVTTLNNHEKEKQQIVNSFLAERTHMNNMFLDEKATLSSTIKSQQETYKGQIAKLEKQNVDERQQMTSKHQNLNAEMEKRHGDEKAAMGKLVQSTTEQFQRQFGRMRDEYDQEMQRKFMEIKDIKTGHEADKKALQELHKAKELALEDKRVQENQSLRENVEALKGALVRRDHFKALSDHELALRFQDLASEIVEFARFRWDNAKESTWPFPEKMLRRSENERRTKQHVIQNTIWVILYENIFCTPFRVLGNEGKLLEREWIRLYDENRKSTGAFAPCPRPTKESEKWRYETMKRCLEAISQPLQEWEPNYKLKRDYELSLGETMEDVSQELERVASVGGGDKQRMSDLVKNAARLWLEIGQQRYRIFLLMSASGEKPSRSGQIYLDSDRTQDLVAVPELRRMGNAQGERLEKDELVADCKGKFNIFHG